MRGASRMGDLICQRSASGLPAEMVTAPLLSKLSQLGRFGLAPTDQPLLQPATRDETPYFGERALGAAGGSH
jgi:hypothetical protein